MLSEAEKQRVLVEWNETRTEYPRRTPIPALFEEQAAEFPASVALMFEDRELTYGELNEQANRVAHHLRRLGAGRGTLVGVCLERSPQLIAGLLGVLKAGGAYVPLDPDYPDERLAYMLRDSGARVILAHRPTASRLKAHVLQAEILCLDADAEAIMGESTANLEGGATVTDLAYVMYTSGSTGTPKGVMIDHRAVVRLVRNTNYCAFGRDEVLLQLAPFSFDASTFEIWGSLLNGARLAIMPPRLPGLDEVGAAIQRYGVTTLWLTSGLFNLMVEQRGEDLRPLRQLVAGGDVLSPPHVQAALALLQDGVIINGYGPTESTTFACTFRMTRSYRVGTSIPIGRPISNTTVYVLDEALQPAPLGAPGELCIGGDGVGRGYLNHPELTRQKFVPSPFGAGPDTLLYRTGDLARYLPDGNIEFLGRIDSQVKILGHRVEPGEIEATLRQHPSVGQTVVTAEEGPRGEKRLVAYVVASGPMGIQATELKDYLASRLPQYMIPSSFIELNSLPLTPNGKVDRSALPTTERRIPQRDACSSQVVNLEKAISVLWARLLNRTVGLDDNFFDLGGDSLLLIEVHSELRKQLPRELSILDLFEYTTVRSLANRLAGIVEPATDFTQAQGRARKQREALAQQKSLKATR